MAYHLVWPLLLAIKAHFSTKEKCNASGVGNDLCNNCGWTSCIVACSVLTKPLPRALYPLLFSLNKLRTADVITLQVYHPLSI